MPNICYITFILVQTYFVPCYGYLKLFPDYVTFRFKTLHVTRATERAGHVVHHQPVKKLLQACLQRKQHAEVQSLYMSLNLYCWKELIWLFPTCAPWQLGLEQFSGFDLGCDLFILDIRKPRRSRNKCQELICFLNTALLAVTLLLHQVWRCKFPQCFTIGDVLLLNIWAINWNSTSLDRSLWCPLLEIKWINIVNRIKWCQYMSISFDPGF